LYLNAPLTVEHILLNFKKWKRLPLTNEQR